MCIACYLRIGVLMWCCYIAFVGSWAVTVEWLIVLLFSTRYCSGVLIGWFALCYACCVLCLYYVVLLIVYFC